MLFPVYSKKNRLFLHETLDLSMLSKNRIKYIRSLSLKKNRQEHSEFIAEGPKVVEELLLKFPCVFLAATDEWIRSKQNINARKVVLVTPRELMQASLMRTPQQVMAIFRIPEPEFKPETIHNKLCLALDGVQDPGNLGTIVRIADWFGINNILCSENTADIYNPKAVQATMGSLARVSVHYVDLESIISQLPYSTPVYGTFLDGDNIYREKLSTKGIIVMGNEGSGISANVEKLVNKKLFIPNAGSSGHAAESLNVAVATAIVCSEFKRGLTL